MTIQENSWYETRGGYIVYFPPQEKVLAANNVHILHGHIMEISSTEKIPYKSNGKVNVIDNYEPHLPFEIIKQIDEPESLKQLKDKL